MNNKDLYPKALQTRLIYPFFYKEKSISDAVEALCQLTQKGRNGEVAVWERVDSVPELYQQEIFSAAQRFLFANEDCNDCRYLRLNDNRANAWFGKAINVSIPVNTINNFTVKLAPKMGVELFLSPFGVGLLSIALEVNLPAGAEGFKSLDEYKLYNYYLSQLRREQTAPIFSLPAIPAQHLNETEDTTERATEDKKAEYIYERLGKAGEEFRLAELCDYLLQGLKGELGLKPVQQQFSVYTVARFSNDVDFSIPDVRHNLGAFLSGLAQIEEVNHAGYIPGEDLDILNCVMNTRHWTAMSFLGAAHFVADQGVEFDNQRLLIVSRKYFIPYLAAFYQRLILQRLLDNASQYVHSQLKKSEEAYNFSQLHSELLDFGVTGLFTEISSREALNRYYSMGQKAFSIEKNTNRVSSAIQNYDINKVTQGLTKNIEQISKIQGSVEWFQILFIVGATAQLSEYIGTMSGDNWYGRLSMLLAPMITGVISLMILRPWKNDPDFKKNKKTIIVLVATLSVFFLCWWGGAYFIGKDSKSVACKKPDSSECADWKAKQKSSFFDFFKLNE